MENKKKLPAGKKRVDITSKVLRELMPFRAVAYDSFVPHLETLIREEIAPIISKRKTAMRYAITRALKHLLQEGALTSWETERSMFIGLTPEGRYRAQQSSFLSKQSIVSTVWDGKWRIVLLDVPEADREKRDSLRYVLKRARFVCFKNSVWISPYPFEDLLTKMKSDLGLDTEVIVIVTDALDEKTDSHFRKKFWGDKQAP